MCLQQGDLELRQPFRDADTAAGACTAHMCGLLVQEAKEPGGGVGGGVGRKGWMETELTVLQGRAQLMCVLTGTGGQGAGGCRG